MRNLILPALFLLACQPDYTGGDVSYTPPPRALPACLEGAWTLTAISFPSVEGDLPWSTATLAVSDDTLIVAGLCPDGSGTALLSPAPYGDATAEGAAETHCKMTLPSGEEGRWDTAGHLHHLSVWFEQVGAFSYEIDIWAAGDLGVGTYTLLNRGIHLRGELVAGPCSRGGAHD